MLVFTSYFYMVRFLRPNFIPVSTAVWDPKWFHEFQDQSHLFLDKNGVVNGLRAEFLAPGPTCENLCRGPDACLTKDPETCPFLQHYTEQLKALPNEELRGWFRATAAAAKQQLQFSETPVIVLLVHEAPNTPCSERYALQKRFNCRELTKEDIHVSV